MLYHLCSHFGDIEIETAPGDKALIKFMRLTPKEREALDTYLLSLELKRSGEEGSILVPQPVVQAGSALSALLHEGKATLLGIRMSTGDVVITRKGFWDWVKDCPLFTKPRALETKAPEAPKPTPRPEAAVEVRVPHRGCPMPTMTEMKEANAAAVVAKFLSGPQATDFATLRSFLAVGCDTGHLYRVTSRWSPACARFGVLHDMDTGRHLCASNTHLPPSEEVLSMKFAIEHMEQDFLNHSDDDSDSFMKQSYPE